MIAGKLRSSSQKAKADKQRKSLPTLKVKFHYRIVQEALTNILKHSQATCARIRMRMSQERGCSVLIVDNGKGLCYPQMSAEHLGLVGMAERMQAIHGTFQLRSSRGKGVCVRVVSAPRHDLLPKDRRAWEETDEHAANVQTRGRGRIEEVCNTISRKREG